MTVSKRTRYEVLKRDNHTCRYCGGTAPDVALTIDHVIPVALGGSDSPENLVAACRDCNYGKASTVPGAEMVADVAASDLRWAGAIDRVARGRAGQRRKRNAYIKAFLEDWQDRGRNWRGDPFPLPPGYETSIGRFYDLGVPLADVKDCARIACTSTKIYYEDAFRYFAGCVWRVVTDMQDAAKALLDAEDMEAK